MDWTLVETNNDNNFENTSLCRTAVPGGWLVKTVKLNKEDVEIGTVSVTFVPAVEGDAWEL